MFEDKNKDSGNMKTGADILTRGGTLIREPCDLCNGVQVRLGNKLTCVNCGRVKGITESSDLKNRKMNDDRLTGNSKEASEPKDGGSVHRSELKDIGIARIKSRILELITEIHKGETFSEELSRAQLISVYLSILEQLSVQ
jgi:uncharacterized Zn finger protein (UPF0148 family)